MVVPDPGEGLHRPRSPHLYTLTARRPRSHTRWAGFLLLALAGGCQDRAARPVLQEGPGPRAGGVARSAAGVVVTGSALASEIGAGVLDVGGNAADAAVAAAFALAVVEPSMSGLGGRTQVLLRTSDGEIRGIDATTVVPASYDPGRADAASYGYATVAVPGTVAGLVRLSREFGRLPLSEVMAPAVGLAEQGFPMPAAEAARIARLRDQLLESEGARTHFLQPDGSPYTAGSLFVQPDLGATLRAIQAGGADAFYAGEIGARIAEDMRLHDAHVTAADLRDYRAADARVVRGRYDRYELAGTYMPASGATVIEALQILDYLDLSSDRTVDRASALAQALLLAFEDREAPLGPPDEMADLLTSAAWAGSRARDVRLSGDGRADPGLPPAVTQGGAQEPPHTTHVSVADADGMVVALTQSVGPTLGARVATPGLGFLYAQTLGGYLAALPPGGRAWSSMSPLLVLEDGEPRLVLGGAGARRIVSALVQVVVAWADGGGLEAAQLHPRLHPTPARWTLEHGPVAQWPPQVVDTLRERGHPLQERLDASWFARINGIEYRPGERVWVGVADPRWSGGSSVAAAPPVGAISLP